MVEPSLGSKGLFKSITRNFFWLKGKPGPDLAEAKLPRSQGGSSFVLVSFAGRRQERHGDSAEDAAEEGGLKERAALGPHGFPSRFLFGEAVDTLPFGQFVCFFWGGSWRQNRLGVHWVIKIRKSAFLGEGVARGFDADVQKLQTPHPQFGSFQRERP